MRRREIFGLGGTDSANYYLSGGSSLSGSNGEITKKAVSLSGARTYDGTTTLGNGTITISTGVGSETLTYTGATAHSKNVGTGNYIDAITLQDAIDASGGLAGNYQLPSLTAAGSDNSVTFARKALTISSVSAEDKTFNGTTNATVALGSLQGLISGESLNLSGTGNFSDPNVGIGKTVLVQLALADGAGGLADNYTISDVTTTAAINAVNVVPPTPPTIPTTPPAPPSVPDPTPPTAGPGTGGGSGSSSGGDTSSGSSSGTDTSSGSGSSSGGDTSSGSGSGSSSSGGTTSGSGSSSGTDTSSGSGSSSGGDTSSGSGSGSSSSGGSSNSGSESNGGSGSTSNTSGGSGNGTGKERVTVTLIKQPTEVVTGAIVVEVASEIVKASAGFSFQLPKSLIDLAVSTKTQPSASLVSGDPLPAWLTFLPGSNTFIAKSVPNDGLPIQVVIKIGNTRTVLLVTERNS